MNGYESLRVETAAGEQCRDCVQFCYFGSRRLDPCEHEWCQCEPCAKARRAAELDDRPDAALTNLARDIEQEARPDVDQLVKERFGRPRKDAA